MFHIPNLVTIFTLLSIFMIFICRSKAKGAVTGCIGIKYPNIKKCFLVATPETSCFYI